ncbi:hypothetical protein [Acinetobacter baumannii]|uniref:hypothetical protein n=1 Tax=Acinetobacter baumannii TaxID=470 RepID=UPI003B42932C
MDVEELLKELILNHIDIAKYHDKAVVENTAALFLLLGEDYINNSTGETFYKLPYKDISVCIFDSNFKNIQTNNFNSFVETVVEQLYLQYKGAPERIEHIKECYDKFTHHILLVQVQKDFMLRSATNANNIAIEANKNAKIATDLSNDAKKLYDGMMVNYITILGIFASIIITIFGGMQIISATTGLLQADIKLATLILVLSLLTLLIVLILSILLNWISNLKDSKRSNTPIFWAIGICSFLILISAVYIKNYSLDNDVKQQKDKKNNLSAKVLVPKETKNN